MAYSEDSGAVDASTLERQLDELGFSVAVEVKGTTLFLSGEVESERDKQAALDLAKGFARTHKLEIDDSIDVLEELPDSALTFFDDSEGSDEQDFVEAVRQEGLDPADDQRVLGTSDSILAAEEAIPYFPPTDPVVEPSGDEEELSVIGGFGAVSYERSEDARPGQTLGDEQVTDLVRRELREDATTIDFDIEVETRNGVVFLRGTVETLDDAENVEAVANRVAGVVDVREELEVLSLMNPPQE
jgi:hypothetical protein